MDLDTLKQTYKEKIQEIANESFNKEQKQIAYDILDSANENNIDSIYAFITQRVKLGFRFDIAPEVNHNAISLCEFDKALSEKINPQATYLSLRMDETEAIHKVSIRHCERSEAIHEAPIRHCEEQSDEAIHTLNKNVDCHGDKSPRNDKIDCHDLSSDKSRNDGQADNSRNDNPTTSLRGSETTEAIHKVSRNDTTHKLIIGENYDALKNLLVTYKESIDVIYIDPPYNTEAMKGDGNDYKESVESSKFIYRDKFTRNGWLNMINERLKMAKKLLKDSGVIFISIDDSEQAYLKVLCDEIFGEENFCGNVVWLKGNTQNDAQTIQRNYEYILCYAKNIATNPIYRITKKVKVKVFKDSENRFYYEGYGLNSGNAEGGSLQDRPKLGYSIYYNPQTHEFDGIIDYDIESAKDTKLHNNLYKDNQELLSKGYEIIRPTKNGANLGRWTWALEKFNTNKEEILIKKTENGYSVLTKKFLDSKEVKENKNGELYAIIDKENPPKNFIDSKKDKIKTNDFELIFGKKDSNELQNKVYMQETYYYDFIEQESSGNGTKVLKQIFNDKVFNNPKPVSLIKHLLKISTKANCHAERSEASNLDSATNNLDISHSLNMTDKIDVSLNAQHDDSNVAQYDNNAMSGGGGAA